MHTSLLVYALHCALSLSTASSSVIGNAVVFLSVILSVWLQVQEANAQLAEQDAEVTPVQRRIEPRSADDSLSGVVRCLCFADTFLRDGMNKWVLCSANDAYSIHRFPQEAHVPENQHHYYPVYTPIKA